jgi:hypothetical protein
MDEILIEEKRYVSSKQAAKLTGYAKDYIGQLCREGRVPARLVGRSWYVLESAIQDHRFGAPAVSPKEDSEKEPEIRPSLSASLETPRYEASSQEELPSIEDLTTPKAALESHTEVAGDLQESWRAWFSQTNGPENESTAAEEESPAITEEIPMPLMPEEPETPEESEVNVPIRAIHHSFYQPTMDEVIPRIAQEASSFMDQEEENVVIRERMPRNRLQTGLRVGGVLIGAISVIAAVLGSGYLDNYILSNKQASLMAGVSFYNR